MLKKINMIIISFFLILTIIGNLSFSLYLPVLLFYVLKNRKNIIDYEKQLSEFYSTLDYKPISANAISIYLILLQIACKTGWLTEFKVTNTILMSKIKKLSLSTLQRARNELINNDYILYKKRS